MSLCWSGDRDTLRETGKRELILNIASCLFAAAALTYDARQPLFTGPLDGRTPTQEYSPEENPAYEPTPVLIFETWRTA